MPVAFSPSVGVGAPSIVDHHKSLHVQRKDRRHVVRFYQLHIVERHPLLEHLGGLRIAGDYLLERYEPAMRLGAALVHLDHEQMPPLLGDVLVVRVQVAQTEVGDDADHIHR